MLFHDRYLIYPEVWRGALNESSKIMISQAIAVLSCLGFVLICAFLVPRRPGAWLGAAVLICLAATVPMLFQYGIWMKLDPLVLASHGAGWLVRFLITALVCAWLLRACCYHLRHSPRGPSATGALCT